MKNNLKLQLLAAVAMAMLIACTDDLDNPVMPNPANPETPKQQAFWSRFDTWQTDSCTVGDDFFMHMIGSWWWNPVDIYPNGLMAYAGDLNDERVEAITSSEPNCVKMANHFFDLQTMSDDEVEQMVSAKVEELWAGATTRDEALAALGRAWAEGYTLLLEPKVNLVNGVPTWQLELKTPSYLSLNDIYRKRLWPAKSPRQNARMKTRTQQQTVSDFDKIIKGMNIGIDHIEIAEETEKYLQETLDNDWNTVEGIKNEIQDAVNLLDGAIVNDGCAAVYNIYVAAMCQLKNLPKQAELSRLDISNYVLVYMGNLYALKGYNQQYITPAKLQQYAKWCEQFRDAMRQRLEANTWLGPETRQNALDKLEKMLFCVGTGCEIPDCVVPDLTGSNLIDDARQRRKAQIDGYCWAMTKTREEVAGLLNNLQYRWDYTRDDAYYETDLNIITITPSNLCSPYVEDDYEDALQWAFLASTIGHELTHGFDIYGSQYDMWGNKVNWWTDADAAKFKVLCDQLTEQYNQLQLMPWADPTLYGNGQLTLAENIADLGGCCLGLQILLSEHPNATDKEIAALTRRYFQGWAIQWSKSYDVGEAKRSKSGTHSLPRERVNGVVRNMDEWYNAYGIKSGSLYLPPAQRVCIW